MLTKSRTFLLLTLVLVSSCTSWFSSHHEVAQSDSSVVNRDVAFVGDGISAYPTTHSFHMRSFKGTTYTHVLKTKIKPALDQLSDKSNGGGGGFKNIGSAAYKREARHLNPVTLAKYKGAKWNRSSRSYTGDMPDHQVVEVYDTLKAIKPFSTVDSLGYWEQNDKQWYLKNDMSLALSKANIKGNAFDLGTLYALTGGLGVKVQLDSNNINYHVMYKTGKTKPHTEVMSGRSFSSSPGRGVADATDPEYLRDLAKYLRETRDRKPFYRALVLSLANSDTSGWSKLSAHGQLVLSDFFTVYTAEAVRHLMVNLKDGVHPWEIDLAAVTVISSLSHDLGKVVTGGQLVEGDIGQWFAPSPNNKPGGPQRSGIGITRRDRTKLQRAIHAFEMGEKDGREIIKRIQAIIGTRYNSNDVIQGVFEYLSNPYTPQSMGNKANELADLVAQFVELATEDAHHIANIVSTTK